MKQGVAAVEGKGMRVSVKGPRAFPNLCMGPQIFRRILVAFMTLREGYETIDSRYC